MRLMDWKDEYGLGIAEIDDEHRQLIETINNIHEELDRPDNRTTVQVFFARLVKEISEYFAQEEAVMRAHQYVGLAQHKEDHDLLLDELRDIMEAFERSLEIDSVDLSMRLDAWFLRHFHHYDSQLHQTLLPH